MEMLESKLSEVLAAMRWVFQNAGLSAMLMRCHRQSVAPKQAVPRDAIPPLITSPPLEIGTQISRRCVTLLAFAQYCADLPSALPPWDDILAAAELYLLYCDCQPLPLFDRDSFIRTLESRHPEVLLSMLALTSRFSEHAQTRATEVVTGHVEAARTLVMQRLSDGPVELSTLQSLCLLSLIDFTSNLS